MRRLADAGPRDFYEGEVAQSIARDVKAMGGTLALEDLRNYHARIVAAAGDEVPQRAVRARAGAHRRADDAARARAARAT